jgi:multicomponent K+:H+ antiporter subunit F
MILGVGLVALALVGGAFILNIYRLVIGPDTLDRVLALDTMTVNAIALIMIGSIILGTKVYFEAALLFAIFGFIGTVAFCKFLMRGDVIE